MVRSICSYSISFDHAAYCVTCGLNQSAWRKMRGLGGEGRKADRPSPTENISKSAIKADSPRRLHLTALAVSKTRLNIRLREMTNLWRIKRIKRITRPARRALRMATGKTIYLYFILNLIFTLYKLTYNNISFIIKFHCTGSVERSSCIAAQVYNFVAYRLLVVGSKYNDYSYAFI